MHQKPAREATPACCEQKMAAFFETRQRTPGCTRVPADAALTGVNAPRRPFGQVWVITQLLIKEDLMLKHFTHALIFSAATTLMASAAHADNHSKQMSQIPAECGKQWTIVDQNNDGEVTFEEGKAFADIEFGRLDANQDGMISQEEFDKCNDLALSAKIVDDAAAKSGEASSSEGSSSADQASGQSGQKTFEGQPIVNGMVMVDATVDYDKDDAISVEETAAAYDKAKAERKDDVVSREDQARYAGSWFTAHDFNNDGMVSMEESTRKPDKTRYRASLDEMDTNKDSNVDKDEWSSYYENRVKDAQSRSKEASSSGGKPVGTIWYFFAL
jgi:hypothetical protein